MKTPNGYWHMTGLHPYDDYPTGSMLLGFPEGAEGIWKKMDGVENFHPGSGIDYRQHPSRTAVYYERVA